MIGRQCFTEPYAKGFAVDLLNFERREKQAA
jgi:hypothetical protein